MGCDLTFATIQDYLNIWRLDGLDITDATAVEEIETALDLAEADVKMALLASDACECGYPPFVMNYLKKLTVVDAAVIFKVSCGPSLTDDLRTTYLDWLDSQFELIRTGQMDACGDSGKAHPAIGIAAHAYNSFNAQQILLNKLMEDQTV